MSIKSGQCYKFTNEENGMVLDMAPWEWHSASSSGKSIVGWVFHGKANQQVNNLRHLDSLSLRLDTLQWITERHDDGQWTIQSVEHQKYLGFVTTPKDGTPLDGINKPQLWDIEVLPDSEDHDNPRIRYV
jgi:hypothetical protein